MTTPGDTRRKLARLLEPERMGRAPAIQTTRAPGPAPTESAESPAPNRVPSAPITPALARRIAALREGGPAWKAETPAPPAVADTPPPAPPASAPAITPLRRRLDALRRDAGRTPEVAPPRPASGATAADFARLFPAEARPTPFGAAWVLVDRLSVETHHGDRILGAALESPAGAALAVTTGDRALADFDLRGALFLDLESTGLALAGGTLPFLVGAAHFQGDALVLEQWLLREPDDEAAALHDLAARIEASDWLVTFNGRTFDLPLLRTRWRLHRQADPSAGLAGHLDLLPPSRRMLKHGLPNARLGTIERHILGLFRVDDVAGSEVPGCYHAWLHDQNPAPLAGVVKHNRLDVLSMVTLLDELLNRVLRPESTLLRDPECALKLAERARRFEAPDLARRIWDAALLVPETRLAAEKGLKRLARGAPMTRRPPPASN